MKSGFFLFKLQQLYNDWMSNMRDNDTYVEPYLSRTRYSSGYVDCQKFDQILCKQFNIKFM